MSSQNNVRRNDGKFYSVMVVTIATILQAFFRVSPGIMGEFTLELTDHEGVSEVLASSITNCQFGMSFLSCESNTKGYYIDIYLQTITIRLFKEYGK